MTVFTFDNFINTTLAGSITSSATTMTLSSSANLPASIAPGTVLAFILNDVATRQQHEIVYATPQTITGATLTIVRAQEGTAAQAWGTNDYVFSSPTAGQMGSFLPTDLALETLGPTGSTTITPTALETVVYPLSLTAPATLTINPVSMPDAGKIIVYGGAYAVTVASNVSSGSPYILLPDGSHVYSWTIPAGEYGSGIELIWDSANWRGQTFGQTVVAAATSSNEALNGNNFSSSLLTSGWKQYPDPNSPTGYFIEQWGAADIAGSGATTLVTLPIAFPTASFPPVGQYLAGSVPTTAGALGVSAYSVSQIQFQSTHTGTAWGASFSVKGY